MMQIDPSADRALYKQLADLIRTHIHTGELAPGQRLPAYQDYVQDHGVSIATVVCAMRVLRNEGLLITNNQGTRVRPRTPRVNIPLHQGMIFARMPTEPERKKHHIKEGVPILIIKHDTHQDGDEEGDGDGEQIYPADQVEIQIEPTSPDQNPEPATTPAPNPENTPPPEHLAGLLGALQGPTDLGHNHDTYLTHPPTDNPTNTGEGHQT